MDVSTPPSRQLVTHDQRRVVLDPQPQSAGVARGIVSDLLAEHDLAALEDTATLLVSELVTNALLHTATPIGLRCAVGLGWLVVEVADGSPVRPSVRNYDAEAMTGRGLGLVELLAEGWGVNSDGRGKTVWFRLVSGDAEPPPAIPSTDAGPAAGSEDHAEAEPRRDAGTFEVRFLAAPTELLLSTVQYGDSVLRELALASISASEGPDGSPLWMGVTVDLGPLLAATEDAHSDGLARADLTATFPAGSGPVALERLALIEEADRMARDGLLLSPPTLPELGACRRWLLSQIALQEEGSDATPWELPDELPLGPTMTRVSDVDMRALDGLATGAVLADDSNRILYANPAAAALLGWDREDLVGQRLVAIIPPELRERHLAAFGRYLVTRQPRMLDRPMIVPALRRDGSRVEVSLTLRTHDLGDGRSTFRGDLRPAGQG